MDVAQTARDVVQTVLCEIQRRLDAPTLTGVAATQDAPTSQVREPTTFLLADERVVGVEWVALGAGDVRLVTDSGRVLDVKTGVRNRRRARVTGVGDQLEPGVKPRRRKPAARYVRPGARRRRAPFDPTDGLEGYGEIVWVPASGGAYVAVVELNEQGNTVGCARLSGEDRNERIVTQVDAIVALAERRSLSIRRLILAVGMSGMRPVRHDPFVPPPDSEPERSDMNLLSGFIREGWVENVIWFSEDRIARKVLPAQMLFDEWQRAQVDLWLAVHGRRMDYESDNLLLGI